MERKRITASIPAEVYNRLEEIRGKRQPMSALISEILALEAEHHEGVLTIEGNSRAHQEKDSMIKSLQDQAEKCNSTVADLTEGILNISKELRLALDEIARRETYFRETYYDRNSIASFNRVLQSILAELRQERDELSMKLSEGGIFVRKH